MRKTALIIAVLMVSSMAAAQPALVNPGQLPGSPFYGLDRASESLELAVASAPFIGSESLKAKVQANIAEERLSEAQALQKMNRTEEADRLMQEYGQDMNRSIDSARKANQTRLTERLQNVTTKHIAVLRDVEKNAPAAAKKGLQNAIRNSQKQQEALVKLHGNHGKAHENDNGKIGIRVGEPNGNGTGRTPPGHLPTRPPTGKNGSPVKNLTKGLPVPGNGTSNGSSPDKTVEKVVNGTTGNTSSETGEVVNKTTGAVDKVVPSAGKGHGNPGNTVTGLATRQKSFDLQ